MCGAGGISVAVEALLRLRVDIERLAYKISVESGSVTQLLLPGLVSPHHKEVPGSGASPDGSSCWLSC